MRKLKGVEIYDKIPNIGRYEWVLAIWNYDYKITHINCDDDSYIHTSNTLLPLSDLHLVHIAKYFDAILIDYYGRDVYYYRYR